MDATAAYTVANLAWLSAQGLPLIIWPSVISSLLRAESQPTGVLEAYFARSLGFALLALGLTVVVLSGLVPVGSSLQEPDQVSPYVTAVALISTLHHATTGLYCHGRYQSTEQMAFLLGTMGSSTLVVFGLWFLLFSEDKTRMSKKHPGFDKHTSGWPFKNRESYQTKKKGL